MKLLVIHCFYFNLYSISQYVVLFRNLHYLQQQLAQAENAEREQAVNAEHSMRVAVEKMRMEREEESPAAFVNKMKIIIFYYLIVLPALIRKVGAFCLRMRTN